MASSPAAVHESLKRRLSRLEGRLEEEKLGREAGRTIGDDIPHVAPEFTLDEDDLEEATGEKLEVHEARLMDRATAAQTIAELEAEIAQLRELESISIGSRKSTEIDRSSRPRLNRRRRGVLRRSGASSSIRSFYGVNIFATHS